MDAACGGLPGRMIMGSRGQGKQAFQVLRVIAMDGLVALLGQVEVTPGRQGKRPSSLLVELSEDQECW